MRRGDRLRQAQGGVAHQAGVGGGVGGSGVVQLVPGHTAQGRDAGGGLLQPGGGEQVLVRVGLLSAWHSNSAPEASHLGQTSKAPRVPGQGSQASGVAEVHAAHGVRGETQKRVPALIKRRR